MTDLVQQLGLFFQSTRGQQFARRAPTLLMIVFLLLVARSVADLSWFFFAKPETGEAVQAVANPQPTKSADVRLDSLASLHLFGEANKAQPVVQKVIDAPDTRLRLTLKGVFASSDEARAMAIIAGDKGQDKAYRIGDKVVGGALLHAVFADRVILKRNEGLETLRLPKPKIDEGEIIRETVPRPVTPATTTQHNSSSQAEQLNELRETLQQNPQQIWEKVRITPVMEEEQIKGYRLEHDDAALMNSLNLRPTDVIVAVNGMTLSDPSTLYSLLNELTSQQTLELSILRDGQPQTIMLSF